MQSKKTQRLKKAREYFNTAREMTFNIPISKEQTIRRIKKLIVPKTSIREDGEYKYSVYINKCIIMHIDTYKLKVHIFAEQVKNHIFIQSCNQILNELDVMAELTTIGGEYYVKVY